MTNLYTLVLALVINCAYLLADDPIARQTWHYVTSGFGLMVMALWLLTKTRETFAAVALAWIAWEQLQVAACGVGSYGLRVPINVSGLCAAQYGLTAYLVGVAIVIIGAVFFLRSRRGRP